MAEWICDGCGGAFDAVIDPPWCFEGETLCDDCFLAEEDDSEDGEPQ